MEESKCRLMLAASCSKDWGIVQPWCNRFAFRSKDNMIARKKKKKGTLGSKARQGRVGEVVSGFTFLAAFVLTW